MGRKQPLEVDRVVVSPGRVEEDAYWEFRGKVSRGVVHHYHVLDANEAVPHPWWFLLHVPRELRKGAYVLLQAVDYPRTRAWTPVARTVINFAKATMPAHRGKLYAKIRLADPMADQKYENTRWAHRHSLPPYFSSFELRAKKQVATTRGSDADALVAVVPREDHPQMIRLFFAIKAWPLNAGLPATTRKALERQTAH